MTDAREALDEVRECLFDAPAHAIVFVTEIQTDGSGAPFFGITTQRYVSDEDPKHEDKWRVYLTKEPQ